MAARRSRTDADLTYRPGAPIDDEAALALALEGLRVADPSVVTHLLEVAGPPPLRRRPAGFAGLAAIVTGQQLSTSSAAAIYGRLEASVCPLEAQPFLAQSEAILRGLGLSQGKVRTLCAVAEAIVAGDLTLETLASVPAEVAHACLVALPGIGPWTADSFLLFCLGHPDAWPAGDLALQEAARVALHLPERPRATQMQVIGERWRPYRGVAARLLWAYYRVIRKGRSGMILEAPAARLSSQGS